MRIFPIIAVWLVGFVVPVNAARVICSLPATDRASKKDYEVIIDDAKRTAKISRYYDGYTSEVDFQQLVEFSNNAIQIDTQEKEITLGIGAVVKIRYVFRIDRLKGDIKLKHFVSDENGSLLFSRHLEALDERELEYLADRTYRNSKGDNSNAAPLRYSQMDWVDAMAASYSQEGHCQLLKAQF